MSEPPTFALPAEVAVELRALFREPSAVGLDLAPATAARALDLALAVSGAERGGLEVDGAAVAGVAVAGAAVEGAAVEGAAVEGAAVDGATAPGALPEEDAAGWWRGELRVPLLPDGGGPSRPFARLALWPAPAPEAAARGARHAATLLVHDALERARARDPLTGLPARPSFDRARGALSARIARGEALALALLDVDGLRALNATAGPAAGDELLATLAAAARELVRARPAPGRVYRYGGDELLLELPGADLAAAQELVRALQRVAAPATLSAGLAAAPGPAEDAAALLLQADRALAAAKARGAGQAQAWSPELARGPGWDRLRGVLTGRPERDLGNVEALLDSIAAVSRLQPLAETLRALVDRCVEVTGAERGLLLERGEQGAFRPRVARARGGTDLVAPSFARSLVEECWREGRAIHHLSQDEGELSPSAAALALRITLCAPVRGEDVPAGVVYVDSTEAQRLDEASQAVFEALVGQVTTALRNAQLYERLLARSRRLEDDLAGREEELSRVRRRLEGLRGPEGAGYEGILGRSPAMQEVFAALRSLEGAEVPVVIEGESGTGKELLARAIHARSPRRAGPWVAVNAAAIPAGLFESELFGHARGAFTGARADRAGLLEEASGGTLFLDEVGELPLEAQAKLLRALQEGELRRVGESAPRRVDVRVVAATNRDLRQAVAAGAFREDLYYRLAVFRLRTPPLRERAGDLPLLVEHLLGEARARGVRAAGVSPAALRDLARRRWGGNVRELRNALERAATLAGGGTIEPEHLEPELSEQGLPEDLYALPLKEARLLFTLGYARRALDQSGGAVAEAARRAGVTRQTLYRAISEGEELERRLADER
ncbi:MAG: sigma 54-interacting transcriptional regulator [Planctomycetota bacterium]